ncbi:hypothetical protein HanXRQr2_Chr07g0296831 [Helianthus annuus]|uniref:Uncharacterized protein n=1 Tax=Helianthus annuus TaxID=4232 RepID=A0A9K3NFV1_HELAN|nr:hypothetical protein HanXRQr2_Chr07g0296831 [Helianthus annuus]KAJ0904871.1 hypothetical protein HanPSC8_Chr07g0287361 [Helianthus annuus]
MLCMPIVCVLSTSFYITCYVCPLCAYLVHCFTLHAMYAHCVHTWYIVAHCITVAYAHPAYERITLHFEPLYSTIHFMLRTPIVCIRSTLFHIALLLHMLIQHMNTLHYILNRCNHLTM